MVLRKSIGASLVENLIIIALVSIASIAILTTFGGTVHNVISSSHVKFKEFNPFGKATVMQLASTPEYQMTLTSDKKLNIVVDGETVTLNKEGVIALNNVFLTLKTGDLIPEEGEVTVPVDTESANALTFNINGRSVTIPKKIIENVTKVFNSEESIESSPILKAISIVVDEQPVVLTPDVVDQINDVYNQIEEEETPEVADPEPTPVVEEPAPVVEDPPPAPSDGTASFVIDEQEITLTPEILDIMNTVFQTTGSDATDPVDPPVVIDNPVLVDPPSGPPEPDFVPVYPSPLAIEITPINIIINGQIIVLSPEILERLNTVFPTIGADDI